MRNWLCLAVLSCVGCATTSSLEKSAERHDAYADRYASRGDYRDAAVEQQKAESLRRRATEQWQEQQATSPAPTEPLYLPVPLEPTIP